MKATRMLLLRHGESEWNVLRRWQGIADVELTDRGREQARQASAVLAARFPGPGQVSVWSSTLRRAAETAAVIADALDAGVVRADPRLVEADAGPWRGLTTDEIDAGWPGYRVNGHRPDGFESRADVVARATSALSDIASAAGGGQVAIVVTHTGLIRALLAEAGITDVSIPNLAGWYLDVEGPEVAIVEPFDPGDIDVDRRPASTTLG